MTKVLFANLTRLCNVNCPRCYLMPENRTSRLRIPEGLLAKALQSRFFSGATLVILQGGEPTIVGETAMRDYVSEIRSAAPHARITMVSNLFALPDWAIEVAHESFGGRIETTWAAGKKMTLDLSETRYQTQFREGLSRAIRAGLSCPVNVELNPETVAAGPDAILDLALETGASAFEFDVSARFDLLREAPTFGPGNYPNVPLSIPHAVFRDFILALRRRIAARGLQDRITSNVLRPLNERRQDMAFNTAREGDFVTLNPDGSVTTNPLFSDLRVTWLGSLAQTGPEGELDSVLAHPDRALRIALEEARREPCRSCRFWDVCEGGASHFPLYDGSGECAGMKGVLERMSGEYVGGFQSEVVAC